MVTNRRPTGINRIQQQTRRLEAATGQDVPPGAHLESSTTLRPHLEM
jgi:hypothetical protein